MANEALYEHVTRVGFDLSLAKTHIAAAVLLDQMLLLNDWLTQPSDRGSIFGRRDLFITGVRGLIDRGLVWHKDPGPKRSMHVVNGRREVRAPRTAYGFTKAGRLVIGLLKEAGVYDMYASKLGTVDARASG